LIVKEINTNKIKIEIDLIVLELSIVIYKKIRFLKDQKDKSNKNLQKINKYFQLE
jgi:hypothetical protein